MLLGEVPDHVRVREPTVKELVSKIASSTEVGTEKPPDPPLLSLQCAVSVEVPEPPIQYLLAIVKHPLAVVN